MTESDVHAPGALGSFTALFGFVLPLLAIVVFLLMPGNDNDRILSILSGICAQRPSHSLGYEAVARGGQTMALEARMYGIFAGFAFTFVFGWLTGKSHRTRLPRGLKLAMLLFFVLLMAVDGVNALLFDVRTKFGPLYEPRNDLRLATGLLCGLAMAAFIAPSVNQALWKKGEDVQFFATWAELGQGLLLMAVVAGISLVPIIPTAWLSVLAGLTVVIGFWIVNVHFGVLAWDGLARAEHWSQLQTYALVGFAMTVGELVGLSALRGFVEGTLHVPWLV